MAKIESIENLQSSLGVSRSAAKLYLAALSLGSGTLTELAREGEVSRITAPKPIKELMISGLLYRQVVGKRQKYSPLNPEDLPQIIEKKKQQLTDLSKLLVQQISATDQRLQVRSFSGINGIHTAFREFFSKGQGDFIHFENSETYTYVGKDFAESLIDLRVEKKRKNRVIVLAKSPMDSWYRSQMEKDKAQLRESVVVSEFEYPFSANIAASESTVMIFEYRERPFALLIENYFAAQSIRSVHQMVWDRYQPR